MQQMQHLAYLLRSSFLYDLQNKEQLLVETNRGLTLNVEEINLRNQYRQWDEGEQSKQYDRARIFKCYICFCYLFWFKNNSY
ncbi:hypothetical protein Lalb_Chr11g0068871 [Lupinus albus]|uniref:Uncharacterized protein n=1 Tax=Lupinus albus TaxID=3870 RepID=A0A6A4PSG3_LUPAL|nr:hypothetical protein Lalb_Chr11g0068871 [Lupinus albus]